MNDSRERIRRERDREKNTYTSPRLALRRVLLLAEGRQFREAAVILSRLGPGVLQSVATDLPIDLLIEALPHSANLIETLLNRLISLEITPRPEIHCEAIAWRLVGLLGAEQSAGLRVKTSKLATALVQYRPSTKDTLDHSRRQLDDAVQGLGTHGLTADATGTLISLHVALKNELHKHVDVYKQALHKLEELSTITVNQDPASSSHQRLLALTLTDVERRLIDNKSLLTIIDKPALRQLPTLVSSLSSRVECDKAVLACVGQVKRTDSTLDLSDTRPVAGVLMSYSRGCDAVLSMMHEVQGSPTTSMPRSPTDSASDGYHSDSDEHAPSLHPDRSKLITTYASVWALAAEQTLPALAALDQLRPAPHLKYKIVFSVVVLSFRAAISLRDRKLAEVRSLLGCVDSESSSSRLNSSSTRLNTSTNSSTVTRLNAAALEMLQETSGTFPLGEAERTVINQVLTTLREYTSLGGCGPLHGLVAAACRAAWIVSLHSPPLRIDTDFTPVVMNPEKHVRYSSGDVRERRSDLIKSFVWPALLDGQRCVFRAVVLTG